MAIVEHILHVTGVPLNHPPIVNDGAPTSATVPVGASFDVAGIFSDPDGDALTLSIVSPTDGSVTLADGKITVNAVGETDVVLRADDGK